MGVDYYALLSLVRNATDADIKNAYRKFSLKYHPERNGPSASPEKFKLVSEAYDVLSDPKKRAIYDQFGEEGLKSGVPQGSNQTGAWTEGYTFHGNADRVFHEFFGGDTLCPEFVDRVDGDMAMSFGGINGRGAKKQDPPIERDLLLTLEELYHGCVKKMKISRRVMNEDGHTSNIRDKILTIHVKRGWKQGTKITFPKEGDQGPNTIPADIVFIVRDRPHPRFRREGTDLIHVADIPLGRALTGYMVTITTLDDRILHIPITEIVNPSYVKVVAGEGMPLTGEVAKKGDLQICFNIIFPRKLTPEQKKLVEEALC